MKHFRLIVSFIFLLTLVGIFLWAHRAQAPEQGSQITEKENVPIQSFVPEKNNPDFLPPLERFNERVTKKPFGIFIESQTSPVQSERFRGFHVGTDFEVFPEEVETDVEVRAICSGKIQLKKIADGYGGLVVQSCDLKGKKITVVYGHLHLDSVTLKAGEDIMIGDRLGILGANKSTETDGERKHLHLGIHPGSEINISGYVLSHPELGQWIDPVTVLK